MITDLLSEEQFRQCVALWMLDNCKGTFLPVGVSRQEFALEYRLPDISYSHTQSYCDSEGSVVSLFRGDIKLSAWETVSGKSDISLTVYKVLKTSVDAPGVEPYAAGYIIAG